MLRALAIGLIAGALLAPARGRLDGSHRKRVTEGTEARWSPDGGLMVFRNTIRRSRYRRCRGLAVIGTNGRGLRRIWPKRGACRGLYVEPGSASFSPDGRRILFLQGDSLWTVHPDGSHARRVLRALHNHVFDDARWSPDGRRIAYSSQRHDGQHTNVYVRRAHGRGRGHRIAGVKYGGVLAWQPLPSRR